MSVKEYSPHSISSSLSKSVRASRSFEQDTRLIPITDTVKINFSTVIWLFITRHYQHIDETSINFLYSVTINTIMALFGKNNRISIFKSGRT